MRRTRLLPLLLVLVVLGGIGVAVWRVRSSAAPTDEVVVPQDELPTVLQDDCVYGGELRKIEAIDPMRVKFTLCFPDVAFPAKVASPSMAIYPSEYLQSTGGGGDLVTHPIGTGPWKFARWQPGKEIVFSANPDYWNGPPKEKNLIFRWEAESVKRVTALSEGIVDGVDALNTDEVSVISASEDMGVTFRYGINVFYLGMINTVEPFDKVEVRQAIDYAIDRQHLTATYYPPGSIAATQFVPPSLFGFTNEVVQPNQGMSRDQRVLKAKQLLAAAGLPNGFKTTMTFRHNSRVYLPDPETIARDIQAQLAEVGITVELIIQSSGSFLDDADAGYMDMYLLGWNGDILDPSDFLELHFGAGASDQFGAKNPELMTLLTQASETTDPAVRYRLYLQANRLIRDWVPMVPITHAGSAAAFKKRIINASASSLNGEPFWLMEDPDDDNIIWLQVAEPQGLYCADETDLESLRACRQVNESLLTFDLERGLPIPALATAFSANDDLTEWTFTLRPDVKFHDHTTLDAEDVVASFRAQWDASSPLHVGRQGIFTNFQVYFIQFLNVPLPTDDEEESG